MSTHVGDLMALIQSVARDHPVPIAREGVVASGSWQGVPNPGADSEAGTVQVIFGDTAAISPDEEGDQPIVHQNIPVATTHLGDQYGPVGGERVVIIPTNSGYLALLRHGDDDTPGAPSGERWISHRNAEGQYDSTIKLTNDAAPGDGLGAVRTTATIASMNTHAGHVISIDDTTKKITVQSATGHTVVIDDVAKTMTIQTAGGMFTKLDDTLQRITHQASSTVYTIYDAAGNVLEHVGGQVGIGDLVSNLNATANAAIAKMHLDTFAGNVDSSQLANFIQYTNLLKNVGTMSAGQYASAIAQLVVGFFNPMTKVNGSGTVLIKG
jgi:hypothetical protein